MDLVRRLVLEYYVQEVVILVPLLFKFWVIAEPGQYIHLMLMGI